MKDIHKRRLPWIVAVTLMAIFVALGWKDIKGVTLVQPLMLLVCFVATLGIALCSAVKWSVSLHSLGESNATHFGSLLYYFVIARAIGLVLPADVSDFGVRAISLKFNHSIPIARASYSVYLDRTFDVVISALLVIPSLLFITGVLSIQMGLILYVIALIGGFIAFSFLGSQTMRVLSAIFNYLFKAICRLPLIRSKLKFDDEASKLASLEVKAVAPKLFLLSALKFFFTTMRFYSVALAIGLEFGLTKVVLFVPSAQLAALFALTPGGLGVADWSWYGLLRLLGMKEGISGFIIFLRITIAISIMILVGIARSLYRNPRSNEAKG